MKRIGNKITTLEPFLLDVSEGILVGGVAGFIFGLFAGTLLWSLAWQMWPTTLALPDIFFAGKVGLWEGILLGGLVSFCWRLKISLQDVKA